MTEPEGGPGSPDEAPIEPAAADGHDASDADTDSTAAVPHAGDDTETDETAEPATDDAVLGDANDALPTSGATPGAVAPPTGRGSRGARRGAATPVKPAPAPTPSEIAVKIDDRISAVFVIVTVAFFILLFVYAVLFGGSGLLTPKPTPRPTPVPTPTVAPTPTPLPTPVPVVPPATLPPSSGSPSGSPAASGSATPAPSGSAAVPSASAAASPSTSAAPSST
jgi:hypothetical protein